MDVRLPNGTIVRNVPEGTTRDELQRRAIRAGIASPEDFGVAQEPQESPEDIAQREAIEAGSAAQSAIVDPILEGAAAVNRGVTQTADFLTTQPINAALELAGTDARVPSITGLLGGATRGNFQEEGLARDVVRSAGELAGPGALGGQILRRGAQSLSPLAGDTESVLRGALRQAGATTPAQDVLFASTAGAGGVLGGEAGETLGGPTGRQVGEFAGNIAGPLAVTRGVSGRAARDIAQPSQPRDIPRIDQADDFARSTTSTRADVAEPASGRGRSGVTPERAARNAEREEAFTRLGAQPTQAQRTRDRELFVQQQDLFKQGGRVTEALERQEEVFSQRASEALRATGGDPFQAPASPIETVVSRSLRADQRISELYKAAREAAPNAKNVRFNNTAKTLRQFAADDQLSGGVISSLRGALEQTGAINGFKPSGRVSVEAAERIRQTANDLFSSTSPRGRIIIRQVKDALDEDVGQAVGEDFFKEARAAKASFERGLDREKFNKFDERNVNIVRDILTNRLTPDDIQQGTLFRAGSRYKAQDLRELKRFLEAPDGEDGLAGLKAWDDIRAAAMDDVITKAFRGPLTERGTQSLSRAGIERAIKSMGREKFNVLFNEQERKFLGDLAEVATFKEPVPGAQLGSGPSGQAVQNAADRLDEKMDRILGFRVPFASSALGAAQTRSAEKKILQLTDDLADIEKQQIRESIRRSRKFSETRGATGAAIGIGDTALPDQQPQERRSQGSDQSRTATQ